LNAAIAAAEALDEADYTIASWLVFDAALTAAKLVAADDEATQAAVDAALAALESAQAALETAPVTPTVDKDALNAAIAAAEALTEADYTAESWAPFAAALASANTVSANAEATQAEVDAATSALTSAQGALVAAPPIPGATLTVSDASGLPGATVNIPVVLTENPGFDCYLLQVTYDTSKVEVTDVLCEEETLSDGYMVFPNIDNDVGTVTISALDMVAEADTTGDGVLFTLVVKIKEATSGGSEIPIAVGAVDNAPFLNINYDVVGVTFVAGMVYVESEPVASDYGFTPGSAIYNGNAQGVTVSKVNEAVGVATRTYYTGTNGTDYATSEAPPTNAGDYLISIDVAANAQTHYVAKDGIALGAYTIQKATLPESSIVWPTASDIWKGDALSTSTLTGGSTSYGTFAWQDDTTVAGSATAAAGPQLFPVVFTPSAETLANYNIAASVVGSVEVQVNTRYDVSGDGTFTSTDLQMVRDALLGKITLTAEQKVFADVDGDGYITAADVMNLMRVLAGLPPVI